MIKRIHTDPRNCNYHKFNMLLKMYNVKYSTEMDGTIYALDGVSHDYDVAWCLYKHCY